MSPSENELRAALHHGEGTVPDADRVIARALRVRHERRRTMTSIASAAAVVAVIAVGGTLLVRAGSNETAGGNGGGAAALPAVQGTHGGNPQSSIADGSEKLPAGAARADMSEATSIACPAEFPRLALPGGGGTGQFGASGSLFGAPVAAMKICVYASPSLAEQSVFDTSTARDLAGQLERGDVTTKVRCPMGTKEGGLAVYAVTSAGKTLPVVTVELSCPWQATNGTAVRYLSPTTVAAIRPHLAPAPNNGSPVK